MRITASTNKELAFWILTAKRLTFDWAYCLDWTLCGGGLLILETWATSLESSLFVQQRFFFLDVDMRGSLP